MSYPEIELLGVQSSFDEMSEVEKIVENTIEIAPDLAGIFCSFWWSGGCMQSNAKS